MKQSNEQQAANWLIRAADYRSQAARIQSDAERNGRMCRAVRNEIARLERLADKCEESAQWVTVVA